METTVENYLPRCEMNANRKKELEDGTVLDVWSKAFYDGLVILVTRSL